MSDIAQILGISGKPSSASVVPAPAAPPPAQPLGYQPPKAMKMQSLPPDVMNLLGRSTNNNSPATASAMDLPMSVPAFSIPNNNNTTAATGSNETKSAEGGAELVKVGNKFISIAKPARKWTWAPFSSSARTDGAIFYHWVRANVEYVDYPFARFDIHLDPVTYNDDEYKSYLPSDTWSRSQTDFLLELARRFELRWPIIHDRWMEAFGIHCSEKIEDLQHRYYWVASKLNSTRIAQEAAKEVKTLVASSAAASAAAANPAESNLHSSHKPSPEVILMETAAARALASTELEHQPPIQNLGSGTSNKMFDIEYERQRRAHMEALWNRSKEDEAEELEIRKELKQVEAQLRKMKKSGRHVLAAAKGKATGGAHVGAAANTLPGIDPAALDQAFGTTAPKPVPQVPYLQSGRLVHPATGGPAGLNKSLLTRMDEVLAELKIPARPIATKRVCDLYDQVRRDALTLLVCQKQVIQKEGIVQSKRLRLSKMGGEGRVLDEETLLGITPVVPVASSPVARSKSKPAGGSASKAKAPPGAGAGGVSSAGKSKAAPRPTPSASSATPLAPKPEATGATAKAAGDKDPSKPSAKKAAPKRKRKPDAAAAPTTATVPPLAGAGPQGVSQAAAPLAAAASTNPSRPEDGNPQAKKRPKKATTSS